MKAITKAEFEAALTRYELEVGGAGEFVGVVAVLPKSHCFQGTSTSSPASLTDSLTGTCRARPRRGDSTYFARIW